MLFWLNSAAYFAPPVTLRRPSLRSIGWPINLVFISLPRLSGGLGVCLARRLHHRTHDGSLAELDLECVVLERLGLCHFGFGGLSEIGFVRFLALQELFGRGCTPWLVGHAAESDAGLADNFAVELETRGDRDQ